MVGCDMARIAAPTTPMPRAPTVPPARRVDVLVGLTCALVLAFYAWTLAPSKSDWGNRDARGAYYNLLVDGFRAGQLSLKAEVPAGLAQLADPYDPQANAVYRAQGHLHDTSYYQGKLYLYFGITPALVLFGPYHAITGAYLFNKQAVFDFASLGFLSSVFLLRAIWRRCFPHVPGAVVAACATALGLANSVPQLLRIPGICEVAIACAYAFAMLACLALWHALHATVHRTRWLLLASVAYGLAVGARPSILFGAVVLLLPVALEWRRSRAVSTGLAPVGRAFAAAVVPILVIGLGLAVYNYARFGDILEFGQRYQLAGDRQDHARHFSASYLWFNFRVYFLQWVPWKTVFPFVQEIAVPALPAGHAVVESAFGILVNTPVTLFMAGVFAAWTLPAPLAAPVLRALITALAVLFGTSAITLALFYGTVMRYQVEFHPALTLLACVGILALEANRRTTSRALRLARPLWLAALAFSVCFSVLLNVRMLADEYNRQGVQLAQEGDVPGSLTQLGAALRIRPDFVPAHNNLGVLQLAAGNPAAAAQAFTAATTLAPDSFEARNGLGRAYAGLGKTAEAAEQFREAVRLQPDAAAAHVNLATMLFQLGRPAEAVRHYEKAQQLRFDVPGLRDSLELARAAAGRAPSR